MRVLITGIDGFVGSHMAEFLLRQQGVEVHGTVFDPAQSQLIRHLKDRLVLHRADILDGAAIERLVGSVSPDRIIHLAGQAFIPSSVSDPVHTFRTNIMGGVAVLDAVRKTLTTGTRSAAVLMVSSGEVFGTVEASRQPLTEEMPLQPVNPYAASKAAIDLIAQEYHRTFHVDVIVVRPFNHAGPRQSPAFVCSDFGRQFAEFAQGRKKPELAVGNLDTRRDFTDVRDVVRAYWMLLERRVDDRIFNVCSGIPVRIHDIIDALADISGIRAEIRQDERRIRAHEAPLVLGSPARLQRATSWRPEFTLRQTLSDVFTYWTSELSHLS